MKLAKMMTLTIAFIMLASFASNVMALEQVQNDEYKKARRLINESRTEDARKILTGLSRDNSSDFKVQLAMIDATLEEARVLKAKNDKAWKSKVYDAFGNLKPIFKSNSTSPEIYVSFAKCYWINDRFGKAERSLKKAFYYNSGYADAHILKGDMYFEKSTVGRVNPSRIEESENENYEYQRVAAASYEQVLISESNDPYMQAMIHYKLADLYNYHGYKNKGKEHLMKAVEVSPDSYWGMLSKEQLGKL